MKIVVIDNLPDGGAKRVVFEQIKYLSKKHQVEYYTNRHRSAFMFNKYAVKVFRFNLELSAARGWQRPLRESSLFRRLAPEYQQMAEQINQSTTEAVIVHPDKHTQAPFILRFLKKPNIYYIHEPLRLIYEPELHPIKTQNLKQGYERLRRNWLKKIDKTNLLKADHLVVNSKFTAKNVWRFYKRKAEVIYPGADDQIFKPDFKAGKKHFLFIGQKADINGYPLLKKALGKLDNKISIKYVVFKKKGFQLKDEGLIKLYQQSIAVLCLSINEPFGLTAIEAMACGVPVIAINEGGYKETVKHNKTGILIKKDAAELVKAMSLLAKQTKLRQKLGQAGRKRAKEFFSWKKHGIKLEKSLKNIPG